MLQSRLNQVNEMAHEPINDWLMAKFYFVISKKVFHIKQVVGKIAANDSHNMFNLRFSIFKFPTARIRHCRW